MSTTDPTGEGGGGGAGGGESATTTNVDQSASPSTPITGTAMPVVQPAVQQQQQQQHPPPSPLSGCYLLVVLPEPHTAQHKDLILNRLAKGFLSWDKDSCHVDLEKELLALVAQAPEGEEARNGERLIQYATENLVTEVLIHPQTNTLLQCIRNLLASFTKHRHIIHAGYTFGGNGSWILQDGTFSLADFLDAFSEHEVQRVLRAYENSVTVDIHCAGVGDWTTSRLSKEACCRSCRVRVNPDDVLTAGVPAITSFTNYIGQYLVSQTLDQLMEPSDVVGNIRFSHPTLYVFPGGQGDAALFGINGFNMLVDGGFARKACFWDFTRHLDRLDAVLITRINNSNIGGMFSVLRKKKEMHVYPQIGHFFCNLVERRQSNSPDGDKDIDPLILNLTDIGQEMVLNLRHINLRAHPCYRDPDPINLYHKVGHGTLDMYVLSPNKESREVRDFLAKWHASDSKLFAGSHKKDSNNLTFPIQNLVSICALLVWQPANPEDNITRILFPGSTPQHKIFEGFERLKHLDFLKHPVCSAKTLSPSASLTTLRDKPAKQKLSLIEKESKKISEPKKEKREPLEPKSVKAADETVPKTTSQPIIPISKPKAEPKAKKVVENKKIETEAKESKKIEPDTKESKKIEKELKEIKKELRKEPAKMEKVEKSEKREDDIKKTDLIKAEPDKTGLKEPKEPKEPKPKPEPKKKEAKEGKTSVKAEMKKSEVTSKQKPSEKKAKLSGAEKKDSVKSSPTTPKKTLNGTATKTEISKAAPKAKPAARVVSSLPAKSAKEANNRKVVEQKKSEVEKSAAKDTAAPIVKVSAKPKPMDRKPISRRTKPVSPSKARMPGSPAKSTRSTPTASVKSDKDGVIRKAKGDKGTTDSSTVSTPSGIESEAVKPIDKSLIEQSEDISLDSIESKVLADLKEEREVVEEIEAVLQKAERIEETRKDDRFEGDDEVTAEVTDKKEEDITEEDVTAEIEDVPKKEGSRKESQELTEEDEYLIVEKEEVYTEDSVQSGEGEQKHVLDEAESEKAKLLKDVEAMKEKGEKEEPEKSKDESPEKKVEKVDKDEKGIAELSTEHKAQLQKEVKDIIASATEIVQKTEEKDDSGKKDSEDITKEPSSLSPDKLDSSEKKTTDTDMKPDVDQKEHILEKMEESQERISTIESGATTTAPTLPEDERIPLDEIKEDIDEKHVIEEVKEKDAPAKPIEEVVSEVVPVAADKPEVKVFDVRQAMQSLQRDIVKTPDEVADLPVHEEVDPKLYRMEDFEKGKEEKPSPTQQEVKEPPTPPVKEQKGVFSFFGKVADKFEKGIDKLTKKTKKDSEKDSDEKSSKSSSPKEAKVQEKTLLEEVDMEKMFPKVSKPTEKSEIFEEVKPTMADVKVAAIKETTAFIQEEILDARRQSVPDIEKKLLTDKPEEVKKVTIGTEEVLSARDISPAILSPMKQIEDKEIVPEIESLKEEDIGEDVEEVKALLEEASKKFKTVKDSLRDSLESLEDKIKEEEMVVQVQHDVPSALKDAVKDTLEGVAEKLEVIKPHIESSSPDKKEPEKVKFDIPKDEEFEEEYEEEPVGLYRDMKEAVRDVGEVLAGTAGIDLEDKHKKDVVEIVKKVAEVLKEDDFLSDKVLFPSSESPKKEEISPVPTDRKPSKEEISPIPTERKPSVSSEKVSPEKLVHEDIAIPRKVGVTEEFPVHEEVEELIKKPEEAIALYGKPGAVEVKEEPCVKVTKKAENLVTSPAKDALKDKKDAQKICAEMLEDDQHICDQHKKPVDDDTSRVDVMQAGIESVCVKEVAKKPPFEEKVSESEIEHPVIGFEQKISPAKAEIVMVTPGSTPTSPKFSTDKMYDQELEIGLREPLKLPEEIKQVISKEAPVEEIIEELIIMKKKKITIEVIEYITVVKRIPRERVIYIIEEIIVKRGLPKDSVVDDLEILEVKDIMPEKRMEVEVYIVNEYIVKGKRITIEVIEEISIKKVVPKKIVIEIIEEIIVKRKIARHMVLDIPEDVLSEIIKEESSEESPEESAEEQITPKIDVTLKQKPTDEVPSAPTEIKEPIIPEKRTEIEEFVVNEYVTKGKKITTSIIDEIATKKAISKKILIEIIEEVIIKRKIPRITVLDITEEEILAISKETPDEEEKGVLEAKVLDEIKEPVTPQQRAEIENYIVNEYVTKGDSINIQKLEDICNKKKMPKRIIIEIIEEIIIKRKMPKHAVLNITEEELSRIIEEKEPEVPAEKRKSIAEVASSADEKKSPVDLKKEEIFEHEVEEELPAAIEEEDVEVDGFVSIPRRISDERLDVKKKAVSPVKTEISLAVKEHDKDVIDDFEAVEQEYKVRDVPVTSPEKADEMKEKEDTEEAAEDTTSEVIEADEKFVQETKGKVGKEEPDVNIVKDAKPIDEKREPEEPETSDVSEVVDTIEKYLDEDKEKTDGILPKESIVRSISPVSDKAAESLIEKPDELKEFKEKETSKDIDSDKRPSIDVAAVPEVASKLASSPKAADEKAVTDEVKEEPELTTKDDEPITLAKDDKVAEEIKLKTKLADATGFAQEPKVELFKDDKKPQEIETIPITKEEEISQEMSGEEALRKKRSISKEPEEAAEEDGSSKPEAESHIEVAKPTEVVKDQKLTTDKPAKIDDDFGTVKRMLVTASSEDGREEIEICPTGSITFTKIVTPDDSLKDASIKSTPDKDSLLLDKDSLHSDVSTPEKDSISEKSMPEGKDKITPEDSLEKSPGTRDSQDLEDSLEKPMSRKSKEAPSIDDDKSKVPEKLEDITKPEPEDKQEKPKSLAKDTDEIAKTKSPTEVTTEKIEKPTIIEQAEKPKSPFDTMAEDVSVESIEKPKLPIEKLLPEPEKGGISGAAKTPESLHSEDISPAETIFSKSPTDKPDMYFTKMRVSEENVPLSDTEKLPVKETKPDADKELSISPKKEETPSLESKDDKKSEKLETKESSPKPTSPIIATGAVDEKALDVAPTEKSRSPSMSSEKHDEKDSLSSTASEKSEDKESSVRSKSPTEKISEGVIEDKRPSIVEKEIIELLDKSRSPSIISDKGEKEDKSPIDKSRSPSMVSEPIDKEISERRKSSIITTGEVEDDKPIEKSRSPSIIEGKEIADKISDDKPSTEKEKDVKLEDEVAAETKQPEKSEEKDLVDKFKSSSTEKFEPDMKSPDKTSDIDKEKKIDKPKLPSDEKDMISVKPPIFESEHYDEKGPIDEARSPSAISDKFDEKKESDRSKSPSIAADKPDFQDVTEHYLEKPKSPIFDRPESPKAIDKTEEPQDKDRYPTIASDKSDSKGISDRSRSPTISIEKVDLKDIDLSIEKARSPSVTSVEDDKLKQLPLSKSLADKAEVPKDELKSLDDDTTDLKDVTQLPQDKSRSSSVASTISEPKESVLKEKSPVTTDKTEEFHDKSKLPSPVEQKLSVEDKEPSEKSRSPSIAGEQQDQQVPGSTSLIQEPIKTSRSSSVSSVVVDKKEPMDRSKSPSIADEKPDLKDIAEQPLDKSRSSSIVSTGDKKEPMDHSKSPSIADEKPDLKHIAEQPLDKSRSSSIVSTGDKKEPMDRSKSPSIADEKPDLKDIAEQPLDKSRSSSIVSTGDKKEPMDRSKSPSIADEKPDLKDIVEQPLDKSRSPSIVSTGDKKEPMDRSKSPSIADEKLDLKDIVEQPLDKSRSPSIVSTGDKKEPMDRSKSPSIADEKLDLKDIVEQPLDKSRSPSIVSTGDKKELMDRSKSPSIADEKPDLKDIAEQPLDKLRSSSIVSTGDKKEPADRSKSPSIAGEKIDLKDIAEPCDKSRSSSVVSLTGDQKEPKSTSPSVSAIEQKQPIDLSKSPSIASEKADEKDILETLVGKSRTSSIVSTMSTTSDHKESVDRSKSPSIAGEKPDLKDVVELDGKSRSPSVISVTSDVKEHGDRSKSPSIDGEKPDEKGVLEPTVDKSRSASIVSVASEQKTDHSKSPSIAGEKPDLTDVTEQQKAPSAPSVAEDQGKPIDRSKSPSIMSEKSDDKKSTGGSKSSSIAGDQSDLTEVTEQLMDKSSSITDMSDQKEPMKKAKSPVIPDKKEESERSKSPSVASEKSAISSKPPSVSGDIADLKDVSEPAIDKSRSPSVISAATDQKELIEKPVYSTIPSKAEEPHDRSKSPSMASEKSDGKKSIDGSRAASITEEKPDLKDVMETPSDKSRSSSVTGLTTEKAELFGKSISPIISDKLEPPIGRSRSSSTASDKPDEKALDDKASREEHYEDIIDKSPGLVDVKMSDKKDVEERPPIVPGKLDIKSDDTVSQPHDKSRSPSIVLDKPIDDKQLTETIDYRDVEERTPIVPGKLDIKSDDTVSQPHDKSRSPSIVLDKPIDDKQLTETIDIDGLKTSSISEMDFTDRRSLSIISDKTEPKSPSDVSKSPSSADDKVDQKDKSRSSSVASEKLDMKSWPPEVKEERAISLEFPGLDIEKKDGSTKSSRASSPVDKVPDRSRSQSVFDIGEITPTSRSRTTSLYDDKLLPEKIFSQEEKDKHIGTEETLDEKVEHKSSSKDKSPTTSPETIQKQMQKIREKRFADFEEPHAATQPSKIEKSDDEEEDIIMVTAEKKAEIEKYILEEFIVKKKKISLVVIEKLVMMYAVPQFVVMDIIEDIISRENMPRSAIFDFVDEESPPFSYELELKTVTPQQRADIEKYITEEFIAKKQKITPELLDEMVILKGIPRYILITIIEEIIVKKQIPRNTVVEGDLEKFRERSPDKETFVPTSMDSGRASITQEYLQSHEKPSDSTKDERGTDGKVSPVGSDRYDRDVGALSASPSFSPEHIPSDKSTQDSPARSEPHIDDEILISEEKRAEVEKLLEEEYIKKGRKITEVILEEIIIRTSLPRYIILEIVEEIILKRKIPRETVIDVEIYQEDEPEEHYDKGVYHYDRTTDVNYELSHDVRKSSAEYRMGMYSESDEQQLDKSVTDYPDYESQFHKAFVGGMTEMRTTHITTLSGKSTPEFATPSEFRRESADKTSGKLPERTLATTHITTTDVEDSESIQPVQTVTMLRESKIAEPHLPAESLGKDDKPTTDKREVEHDKPTTTDDVTGDDVIIIKKVITREVIEGEEEPQTISKDTAKEIHTSEPDQASESDGDIIVTKKIIKHEIESQKESEVADTKRSSIKDEPEAITKIIKRQILEHEEPEVVTKVIKREIIEQDEPEIITKVIRREIVLPDEETSDSKEDSDEYVKTITTKTTRTIVTEELPDAELSQTDPSKIYTDPTSGATYRVVSEDSAPDATASADVKRIVTTVTTITGPDGKITTKKDVKESTDTVDSEELLEKLIDSDKVTTETTKSAEKIIKETITSVTSGTSTPDMKVFGDSGKSTPDSKQEDKLETKERLGADKFEHSVSPLIRDLISDDKSYSGKSSPDISLPKDIVFSGSTGKSTPEIPMSPLIRDGAVIQPHVSGRSTPDRRSDGRSSTGTPEGGFRSGEIIRTIITTTKTISDEGEIVTTTKEVTETTNEKGETIVLAEKTDVKVDERLPSKDTAESAISSIIGSIKSSELQRSGSPGSDDGTSEKDRDLTSPASEQSSVQSKPATHIWGSEERHTYSDDEPPSSSLSSTSQIGYSPQPTRRFESTSDKEEEQKQVEFSTAAMSSSFYGELPAVPPQISAMKTFHGETGMQKSSDPIPIHSRFMVEKEFAGGYVEKPDAKKYVDEADLDFDKALMEHKEMKEASGTFSSGISPRYTNGSLRHETDDAKDHPSSSFRDDSKDDSKGDSKKDPLDGWGTPLGLPSPKPPRKFNLKNPAQPSCSSEVTSDTLNFDVMKDWGEPLRLPSPAPVTNEVSNKGAPGTPKKERKQAKKVQSENIKNKKRSESPGKNEKKMKDSKNKVQPVYMDLAYVPHHGNSYYTSLEFFKRVRARYYVFSGTEPSREVYDALLEAKKTWEDKDLEVTMIPTYDTDTLGYWVADNEEALAANHIDLSPSASRCTINLQDHETSCSAYRLEF